MASHRPDYFLFSVPPPMAASQKPLAYPTFSVPPPIGNGNQPIHLTFSTFLVPPPSVVGGKYGFGTGNGTTSLPPLPVIPAPEPITHPVPLIYPSSMEYWKYSSFAHIENDSDPNMVEGLFSVFFM